MITGHGALAGRRGTAVVAGGVALAIAAVAAFALLKPDGSGLPVASSTPTSASVVTPDASSRTAVMDWTIGTPPDGHVAEIERMDDGWLAVGSVEDGENLVRAATWTSVDGVTWELGAQIGPDPAPEPNPKSYFMTDVIVLADKLVGIGWNQRGCCDTGTPALWRSTDGVNWTFVETAGTVYGDMSDYAVEAALAPSGEIVIVSGTDAGAKSRVFTSRDGVAWIEQPFDIERMGFVGLAASDDLLLAVGYSVGAMTELIPLVLTSADGRSWSVAEPPASRGVVFDVAWDAVSARFVVVGRDAEARPTAWSTVDGTSWQTTPLGADGIALSVGAADGVIVATGYTRERSGGTFIAWSSLDGVVWQAQPLEAAVGEAAIVAMAGEEAVLYFDGVGSEEPYGPITGIWAGAVAR